MGHFYVSVGLRLHFNPKSFPQHYEPTRKPRVNGLIHSSTLLFPTFFLLSRCFTFIIHVGARRTIVYKTKKSTMPLTHRVRFFISRSLILLPLDRCSILWLFLFFSFNVLQWFLTMVASLYFIFCGSYYFP